MPNLTSEDLEAYQSQCEEEKADGLKTITADIDDILSMVEEIQASRKPGKRRKVIERNN